MKFNNKKKESKKGRMHSNLLKLQSKYMKTKTKSKNEPLNKHKNDKKVKAMGNITPITGHSPRNG